MKARRTVDKKFQERIRDEVKREFEKQSGAVTQRIIKIFCIALHQEFGFGKDRLMRMIAKLEEIGIEREQDEVFWAHVEWTDRSDSNDTLGVVNPCSNGRCLHRSAYVLHFDSWKG